ncbi:hypothetical protein GGH19_001723 [Coemansia sp. RSA 1807]|nr:hypothetical protein IW142_004382 [Coemansia sp. RSA 564]KAJ2169037.1 hypothetical protein GGH15_000887 [Coemansia sp. RSA 562]KAJ2172467.1 hypothetical protein GGH16_002323 [Coemansia sp. RSA 560]KAJ2192433.1 hypothetical protein IW144_004884 [Coemansia sp. RSA 522]KAJ2226343.1 hypothetical protein EV180_002977 [Coemansia sp. RSA 518]KAJ2241923.1 hypothetical protein GGH97_004111 [Coemansia sp. RSA 475]KAJ2286585.1 hypothetical protein IW141_005271 [Coemansia sp. RSA 355]KAJ2292077.1 hyp
MLPSVRELLSFCDTPLNAGASQAAEDEPLSSSSQSEQKLNGRQRANSRQRPGRKAGCTDRHSELSGGRAYQCGKRNCSAVFKRPEHLKRHILVHTQERPFQCRAQGCGRRFSRRDNYATHTKKHSPDELERDSVERDSVERTTSETCESSEGSAGSTRAGTPTAAQPPATVSSIFGLLNQNTDSEDTAMSAAKSRVSEPADINSGALHPLDLLAYASTQAKQSAARDEVLPPTLSSPEAVWRLSELGDSSMTDGAVGTGDNPAKPFKCPMCDICFGRLEHVKRHQLVHTGERQFECPTCNKTFARKDNMIQHVRAHERKSTAPTAAA